MLDARPHRPGARLRGGEHRRRLRRGRASRPTSSAARGWPRERRSCWLGVGLLGGARRDRALPARRRGRRPRSARGFPLGTLAVNLSGAFAARACSSARRSSDDALRARRHRAARRLHDVHHLGARDPPARRGRRAARSAALNFAVSLVLGVARGLGSAASSERRCERGLPQAHRPTSASATAPADGFLADALHRPLRRATSCSTSLVLRGAEGFGAKHHLRTDRLLTLSEDLPLVVGRRRHARTRIEAALRRGARAPRSTAWSRSSARGC